MGHRETSTMNYVFTAKSLQAFIEHAPNDAGFSSVSVPSDGSWLVLGIDKSGTRYILHRDDTEDVGRIILMGRGTGFLEPAPQAAWRTMFQRIHRVALSAQNPPLRLPTDWAEFHNGNLVAFFAAPKNFGAFRWVAEIGPENSRDICFWSLTSDKQILLQEFKPEYALLQRVTSEWKSAFDGLRAAFDRLPAPQETEALQIAVDLEATTFGAVTQHRTYSMWLEHLTQKQREFVEYQISHSVKLRGPAGSGKTLALELKALHELYAAQDAGKHPRILFATHSWAIALQVDEALRAMDERGDLSGIEVLPLLGIAKAGLPSERSAGGYQLLGEDSLSGKRLQLERIDAIVDQLVQGDWLTYRKQASAQFRARLAAQRGSPERNALVWDLMNEFSCVLSAHGILPGINAERRYLAIQRTPWMMPLETDADKRFAIDVYSRYVEELKAAGLLTSDQLVNDYLNYLETFIWNLKRDKEGYDLIFVDELHLFNEQERLVLHYLMRSADEYPKMFMALDPRQAPSEVYVGFQTVPVTTGQSGTADQYLGDVTSLDLLKVHRFTPEILSLVRHIHRSYPALDLGADWEVDIESVESTAPHGDPPSLSVHKTREAEVSAALERARSLADEADVKERVAVVLLDPLALPRFEAATHNVRGAFCIIQSRDDVDTLRYQRRSIVLTAAEYIGGLQFDHVVVAGFPETAQSVANLGHQRRRFLSLLYLAVSRAARHVELHVNESSGGVPDLLESAVANKIVTTG
jgi:hypothetical protein